MEKDLALFNKLASLLLKNEAEHPVTAPISPESLHLSLNLSLEENPASEAFFEETLEKLILNTPRTTTQLFFNQLFGGRNSKATLGDLLAVLLNNSMYTYKVAGPQVGIEKEILHKICNLIGYAKESDGTFAPGGSMSNFMAMIMARDRFNTAIKNTGVLQKMTLYTSSESHYSIPKNAAFMGIGREQVRYIETNEFGQMLPKQLENQIKTDIDKGFSPFFINATAGTTVLGAFDNIESLSEISKKYDLWLHVDGAYCGGVIFSKKHRHLVKGLEKSDSFSVNAHKMLGTPLSCSILVTQYKKYLYDSFSNDASYLYQTDGDDYNLGKTSLQCGRRNDALKLWTLWKSVGTNGLAKIVDKQFELAKIARDYISNNPDYTLYSFDESISVCFNYKNVPAHLLCTELYEKGKLMVGFGTFNNIQFVRLVTINSGNEKEDILHFFNIIENFVAAHKTFKQPEIFE
tara:strand:- start:232321 stop:233706 length:1386 start_codon:yes stop_codon:yes gene_type:complete